MNEFNKTFTTVVSKSSEMYSKIEFAKIIPTSCDDGPGIRTVLFLQGCSKGCIGCHNKAINRHGEGHFITVEDLVEMITTQSPNRKLTISGGEPLEQLTSLLILLKALKKRKFSICLYTGWDLKQIPQAILNMLDYVKVGDFKKELSNEPLHFVGSSNQQMYRLNNGKIAEIYQLKEDI